MEYRYVSYIRVHDQKSLYRAAFQQAIAEGTEVLTLLACTPVAERDKTLAGLFKPCLSGIHP